jgi:hypothetical protein
MNVANRLASTSSLLALAALVTSLGVATGCSSDGGKENTRVSAANVAATSDIARIALANVGKGACSENTGGTQSFASSCHGNGGQPEYWCADFVRWVWAQAGVENLSGLTAAAGSFYMYGKNNGTLHDTPHVGDAVVFNSNGGGYADHVAVVTVVNANGTIEAVSGDWGGKDGSEAYFSSTSYVVVNAPAFNPTVGTYPSVIGMKISGYISPVGADDSGGGSSGGGGDGVAWNCDDSSYGGAQYWTCSGNDIYRCDNGTPTVTHCADGCVSNAVGTDDACKSSAPPPPAWNCSDSDYQGTQYWTCSNGNIFKCDNGAPVETACNNGCVTNAVGTDDACQ